MSQGHTSVSNGFTKRVSVHVETPAYRDITFDVEQVDAKDEAKYHAHVSLASDMMGSAYWHRANDAMISVYRDTYGGNPVFLHFITTETQNPPTYIYEETCCPWSVFRVKLTLPWWLSGT